MNLLYKNIAHMADQGIYEIARPDPMPDLTAAYAAVEAHHADNLGYGISHWTYPQNNVYIGEHGTQ